MRAILPLIDHPSPFAFRSQEDAWLHTLRALLTDATHSFDDYSADDLLRLVDSAPKDGSTRSMTFAPCLSPVVMAIWQRRSDALLRILEWSKELVRHDMARAYPQEDSPFGGDSSTFTCFLFLFFLFHSLFMLGCWHNTKNSCWLYDKNQTHPICCTANRSEERRVGKECVSTSRSRWSPSH